MIHNWQEEGKPLIFESMVFGGQLDESQERYSTWEEAEMGHNKLVEKVKKMNPGCMVKEVKK